MFIQKKSQVSIWAIYLSQGGQYQKGDNLKVVWAEFSTFKLGSFNL